MADDFSRRQADQGLASECGTTCANQLSCASRRLCALNIDKICPDLHPEGIFKLIDKMRGVQGETFHTPTILLSGAVSGEEEAILA